MCSLSGDRLQRLKSSTIMVGRFGYTAITQPANYPEFVKDVATLERLESEGLRFACPIKSVWGKWEFLFHVSNDRI